MTWKEERFIDEYLENGGNASAAYREIFRGCNPGSAGELGSRLLKKVEENGELQAERDRLSRKLRFDREKALRILVSVALTTPDQVTDVLRSPNNPESYIGLRDKRFAVNVQKTPDGYVASAPTISERKAAVNDLWEKLGLGAETGGNDRSTRLRELLGLARGATNKGRSG